MLPNFLIPETVVREAGSSEEWSLEPSRSESLLLTLGVTRMIEQESLDVSIWGSADKTDWGVKPILSFPQKFYCGTYQLLLDLSRHPGVRHLKVKWQVNRWGRGDGKPLFGIYLFAQATQSPTLAKTA